MKFVDWKLKVKSDNSRVAAGTEFKASVPGDITADLYKAGLINDPYFGLNHKELGWIIESDFEYSVKFDLDDIFDSEEILLEFDSVDTFANVYLNGVLLGNLENMFLKRSFSIKDAAKRKDNELVVDMTSTAKVMDGINDEGYFGVFNNKRLFIRKAQCHFGWDWAPDMPGYGICGDVRVVGAVKNRLDSVSYRTFNDGNATFYADLTYTVRSQMDSMGKTIKEPDKKLLEDELRYTIAVEPNKPLDSAKKKVETRKITGKKNFVNFKIDNPKLWWPVGMGEHPLYDYKIELIRDGKVVDSREGKFAFREIKLNQKPTGSDTLGYKFEVNGKETFIKGSNWVPVECFTGIVTDEKYENLVRLAKNGNFNMLRVWGGGVYERDSFYDICDKYGIMVWQDIMLACADIPEDDPKFVENVISEVTYQVKRLRNHPSLVYWCGGNEKTGSYGLQISRGDRFIDVTLRGLINDLDGSRPYARQSPCSQTDIGNDRTSGESHAGSYEPGLLTGVDKYRDNVEKSLVPFVSECAVMGADTLEAYKKMFPEDKLWDMNEYWDDRLMDNPYSAVDMPFTARQKYYADGLYGASSSIEEFIAKSMTAHAELLRAEIEFARANEDKCGGFMNWMYSDIWPSATWAVVDYYSEPKQAYYQMKKSYAPVLAAFVQKDGKLKLALVNDGDKSIKADLKYGMKKLSGEIVWVKRFKGTLESTVPTEVVIDKVADQKDCYLFVDGKAGDKKIKTIWSKSMWKNCDFESDYDYSVKKVGNDTAVTVKANKFAKGIILRAPENFKYIYEDNYFDLEAGEEKTVLISGGIDSKDIVVTDYAKEIRK